MHITKVFWSKAVAERWDWLDEIAGKLDEDFIRAVREQPAPQKRAALKTIFK